MTTSQLNVNTAECHFEQPLTDAPTVHVSDKLQAVPQQFLSYSQSVDSVQCLLERIQYSSHYQLVAGQEGSATYLQVAIIGHDNYQAASQRKPKIVYGRKWFIPVHTPSSEIIQTAFLAIQKAQEHEVRERLVVEHAGCKTTPYSSHMDLPLLCTAISQSAEQQAVSTSSSLASLTLFGAEIQLESLVACRAGYLVDVTLGDIDDPVFHFLSGQALCFQCHTPKDQAPTAGNIVTALLAAILERCHQQLARTFLFDGVARFNPDWSPQFLAAFSLATRRIQTPLSPQFQQRFASMCQQADMAHAPRLPFSACQQLLGKLEKMGELEGYLPQPSCSVSLVPNAA